MGSCDEFIVNYNWIISTIYAEFGNENGIHESFNNLRNKAARN